MIGEGVRAAISMAEAYRLAPTPQLLELLMIHARGEDDALTRAVDDALARPGAERATALEHLQSRLWGEGPVQRKLEHVHDILSREVRGISERLTLGIDGNHRMTESLRLSLRELAQVISREEMQIVCRQMVRSGRTHLDDTRGLSRQLERSQFLLDELQRELTVLREQASMDPLTGLPNRRCFDERITALLARGARFCMALLDLDNFKGVNDRFGHAVGDNILRGLAAVLKENTKVRDLAMRFGGEEFVLILPGTPIAGAQELCERIRRDFGQIDWVTQSTQEPIGRLTLSAGATEARPGDTPHSLFDRVDRLLYTAKDRGRNQTVADG